MAATVPKSINPPAFNADQTRDLSTRLVEQQWRDAASQGIDKRFPMSLNESTSYL